MQTTVAWLAHACEIVNKRHVVAAAALVACLLAGSATAAQPEQAADPAHATADAVHDAAGGGDADGQTPHTAGAATEAGHADEAHADDAHGGEHHEESIWVTLARVGNFALLAGGLFYFLRGPVSAHLASRGEQIRGDLAAAARMKAEAAQRLADIEQKLKALPAELELVKQRGAEEVAAEEARMAQQAEVERQRLVTQARREIDQQVRTARQALTAHAASLSIAAAREHLHSTLTDSDRQRLADEFTNQVGGMQ